MRIIDDTINNTITAVKQRSLMDVIDAGAHSEHAQVIKCDFKPGSVERSIDL
jgi:hypothetical protein